MSDTKLELPEGMTADDAADVLGEYHTTEDAQIVSADTLGDLEDTVEELAGVFRSALEEQTTLSSDTIDAMPVDALANEFRNDDGEIEVSTLSQSPETQTGGGSEVETETLSASEKEEVQDKLRRAEMLEDRTPEHADTLRSEAADIAGVEDAEDIEVDAL